MGINTQNYIHNARIMAQRMKDSANIVGEASKKIASSPLTSVPGLGSNSIQSLNEVSIDTVEKLVSADESVLKKVLNPVTLKQVKAYIKSNAKGNESAQPVAG